MSWTVAVISVVAALIVMSVVFTILDAKTTK